MKHFNSGNIWGKVASCEQKKVEATGTPYLVIEIECPNELYGNIKTYARLFGADKIAAFADHHKTHPGAAYRFQGLLSQYDNKGNRYSNYTLFGWQPVETHEYRAAFVLVGEVEKIEDDRLYLCLVREGSNQTVEEHFIVYALDAADAGSVQQGDVVQVKGVLRYKDAEDYFGGYPEGKVLPYAMDIKVRKQDTTDVEAF